jgi:glycosyltransferase involved in cell wall biosynthesis
MSNGPLVSIIIPTFNSERTVSRAIESILRQTLADYEVLVMDAVSNDKTLQIVHDFNDRRVKVWCEKDEGIFDAMNKGIRKASGEWIYFLGSDDYLIDESVLENVFVNTDVSEIDFVYGNVHSVDYGENYDGEFDIAKILSKNICHQAIFVRKSVLVRKRMFNRKYALQADYDFNLRCMFDRRIRKKYINRTIAWYAPSGSSFTKPDLNFERDKNWVLLKNGWKSLSLRQLYQLSKERISEIFSSKTKYE